MARNDELLQTMTIDTTQLAAAIAAGIATIAPKPEMKEGDPEYVAKQKAEGWYDFFTDDQGRQVTVLQNAYEAEPRGLPEDVRMRAARLRPGSYIKNRVKVTVERDGAIVRLSYPIKGDEGLKNMQHWSSFEDMISKIWAEMHPAVN
jgi:hypothetical protein